MQQRAHRHGGLPDASGVLDRVLERAEAGDLELADVTGLERDLRLAREADAGRRAGGDQVARRQRHDVREVLDDVADVEDEVLRVAVLHQGAVDPRLEARARAGQGSRAVGDIGADGRQRVSHLPGAPLARVELEVAGAGVVDDGVAIDVVEGLAPWARSAPSCR